jgi:hypothetical protein
MNMEIMGVNMGTIFLFLGREGVLRGFVYLYVCIYKYIKCRCVYNVKIWN